MKTEERLEAQSRRDNLWFYGFDDKIDESWEESETRVRNYIEEHLNIEEASIKIKRAHRIRGKYSPRPIIVKFWHYKVRENVLKAYRKKNEKMNQAPDNPSKEEYIWKIVSEYDQEIPQSQTTVNPLAPRGRATQPSRDTRKTN